MSKENKKIVFAVLSLFVWPIGIILYFVHNQKDDAKLFGILGIIGLILFGGVFFL